MNKKNSSIQQFMNFNPLFSKQKGSDEQQPNNFKYFKKNNRNKYTSLRYGNDDDDKWSSQEKEEKPHLNLKKLMIDERLSENEKRSKQQQRHKQLTPRQNRRESLFEESTHQRKRSKESKRFERSPDYNEIEDRQIVEENTKNEGISVAWQSQIIKSSRDYFDSCRDSALEYIKKLEGMLIKSKDHLRRSIEQIRNQVIVSIQEAGDKIKEDLYLAVDEAVDSWKADQSVLTHHNQLAYFGEVVQLSTQVDERIKNMSLYTAEIQDENHWKGRASDLLTSNYEADIIELSKLCDHGIIEASKSSKHFMQVKAQTMENQVFLIRQKLSDKIKQSLRLIDEEQENQKTPRRNRKHKNSIEESQPMIPMTVPRVEKNQVNKRLFNQQTQYKREEHSEDRKSHKRKQIFKNNDKAIKEKEEAHIEQLRERMERIQRAQQRAMQQMLNEKYYNVK